MARTPSIETQQAVREMEKHYCDYDTKCLPRGSYQYIAEIIGVPERIVSKNARLQEMAHVHHSFDDNRCAIKFCWICKKKCDK